MNKREVTSSVSMNYVGISGMGLTTYLTLSTRRISNKTHKAGNNKNEVVTQDLRRILEEFKYISPLKYRNTQIKNDPT